MSHYTISAIDDDKGMDVLREVFPDATADELNICLFSTSGVHGSYLTIEEVEAGEGGLVTFVLLKPRMVSVLYGNCRPTTEDDFLFLKKLRESSCRAVLSSLPEQNFLG